MASVLDAAMKVTVEMARQRDEPYTATLLGQETTIEPGQGAYVVVSVPSSRSASGRAYNAFITDRLTDLDFYVDASAYSLAAYEMPNKPFLPTGKIVNLDRHHAEWGQRVAERDALEASYRTAIAARLAEEVARGA